MSKEENGRLFDFSTVERLEQYCHRVCQCYEYLWKLGPLTFGYTGNNWNVDKIKKKNKNILLRLPKKR